MEEKEPPKPKYNIQKRLEEIAAPALSGKAKKASHDQHNGPLPQSLTQFLSPNCPLMPGVLPEDKTSY